MRQKLLDFDQHTTTSLRIAEKPGILRSLAVVLAHSGDSWFWLIGLAFLWWQGPPFWQARAQLLALGVILTAVTVILIKLTVRRRRPEGEWGALYRTTDPHSFPSGHAARAVLLAALAVSSGPAWFAVLLLVWAPLVSLARVAMGVHYLMDILAGMALGLAIGLLLPFFYVI
jgi:membrane-associated phospholipid phosphatase